MFPATLSSKSKSINLLSKRFKSASDTSKCDKNYSEMSGAGARRTCADTIRRSRQNVAIATQVLNPRAFGSSLKCQRTVRHFGPADDDEEGFLTLRRRTVWRKICFYGISILGTILILTAIIIAIGYLQSEKQSHVLSRSALIKSFHERKASYSVSTTPLPEQSVDPTEAQEFVPTAYSSFLRSSKEDKTGGKVESDDLFVNATKSPIDSQNEENENDHIEREYFDPHGDKNEREIFNEKGMNPEEIPYFFGHSHYHYSEEPEEEVEPYEETDHKVEGDDIETQIVGDEEKESVKEDNKGEGDENWKSLFVTDEHNKKDEDESAQNKGEELDTLLVVEEVKVIDNHPHANDDVFSIEVPIYVSNRTIRLGEEDDNVEAELGSDIKFKNSSSLEEVNSIKEPDPTTNKKEMQKKADEFEVGNYTNLVENNDADHFHRAVLHTALFHVDEERFNSKENLKPAITSHLKSERNDIDLKRKKAESKLRGRNRMIKILKNDKVMNLKATFNPTGQGRVSQKPSEFSNMNAFNQSESEEKSDTIDFANIKDFIVEIENVHRRPIPSPSRNILKLSKSAPDMDGVAIDETARSVPYAPSANLVAIIQSLLAGAGAPNKPEIDHHYTPEKLPGSAVNPLINYNNYHPQNLQLKSEFSPTLSHPPSPVSLFPTSVSNVDEEDGTSSNFHKRNYISGSSLPFLHNPSPSLNFPQNENNFAHLLGQNPTGGVNYNPSNAGASLSNYYSPIYPATTTSYDFTSSGSSNLPQLAPGVVPFDLAASYIPAVSFSNLGASQSQSDHQSPFPLNNYFPSQLSQQGSVSPYSFLSPDTSKSNDHQTAGLNGLNLGNIGSLTTASGQAPTYNTIAQGIHLLNMISGLTPATYFHDQVYHPSQTSSINIHPDGHNSGSQNQQDKIRHLVFPVFNALPAGALPELKAIDFTKQVQAQPMSVSPGGTTATLKLENVNQKQPLTNPTPSPTTTSDRQVFHFQDHDYSESVVPLPPLELLEDDDQLPAASALTREILASLPKQKLTKSKKAENTSNSEIIPLLRSTTSYPHYDKRVKDFTLSEPRSFSFEILPNRHRTPVPEGWNLSENLIDDTMRNLNPEVIHTSPDNYVSESKSKKKGSASLEIPSLSYQKPSSAISTTLFSYPLPNLYQTKLKLKDNFKTPHQKSIVDKEILSSKNVKKQEKKEKPSKNTPDNGLKSGFFVI